MINVDMETQYMYMTYYNILTTTVYDLYVYMFYQIYSMCVYLEVLFRK